MSVEDTALLPLLFALLTLAELLHVEQAVTGLDCVSCAESAPRNLKKIKGVESATFRTEDSVAVLELKPGNTVALAEIRDALKRMGYTPAAAKVSVRGELQQTAGKWTLRVAGADGEYPLEAPAGQPILGGGKAVVDGSLADPSAALKVTAIRKEE
jgi:copper chaperone CopZ